MDSPLQDLLDKIERDAAAASARAIAGAEIIAAAHALHQRIAATGFEPLITAHTHTDPISYSIHTCQADAPAFVDALDAAGIDWRNKPATGNDETVRIAYTETIDIVLPWYYRNIREAA